MKAKSQAYGHCFKPVFYLCKTSLIMCAAAVVVCCWAAQSLSADKDELSDARITTAIETALTIDQQVSAHLIDVQTNNGIVTLTGTVDDLLASERAVKIAGTVKGVRSVINKLDVKTAARTDRKIKNDVEVFLASDPATESYEVNVSVDDGMVTLSGSVDSWAEKQLAATVAKSVRGVTGITNNITIAYDTQRADFELKTEIERRLAVDPYIDEALIDVAVEGGNVTLSGSVGSLDEKTMAVNKSWVAGVESVDDSDLKVQWWARDEMRRTEKYKDVSDKEIKKNIEDTFLYDPRVFSFEIDVQVNSGAVTLSGTVDNLMAKKAAERDAENTIGVWAVYNHIRVRPEAPPSDDEIADRVKNALLRDATVEGHEVSVTVKNQKVYLDGEADTYYEKEHAGDVASRIAGVVEVKNDLTVQYEWTWKSDRQIKADIEDEFFWSPYVDSDDIAVKVENGVATLTGKADSWFELDAAVDNAFDGGAKSVNTKVQVNGSTETQYYYSPKSQIYYDYPYYPYPYPY